MSVFAKLEHRPFKQRYQFVLLSFGYTTNRTRTSDGSMHLGQPSHVRDILALALVVLDDVPHQARHMIIDRLLRTGDFVVTEA